MEALRRFENRLRARYGLQESRLDIGGRPWSVLAVGDQGALVDSVETDEELDRFPYGLLLWASAIGLAEYLAADPGLVADRHVLELGAGAGLPGLVARHLGARIAQTDYQLDSVRLAQLNGVRNGVHGIDHFVADWRGFEHRRRYDVVLGSDVLYERTVHYELERVLRAALRPGGLALVSDPLRPQAMEFVDRLERGGWRVDMESRPVTWPEDPREIAIFSFHAPAG